MQPEEAIRLRAYFIWMDSGCVHGNANIHWLTVKVKLCSRQWRLRRKSWLLISGQQSLAVSVSSKNQRNGEQPGVSERRPGLYDQVGTGWSRTVSGQIRKQLELDTVVSPKSKLTKPIKKPKALGRAGIHGRGRIPDITSEGPLRQSFFKGLSRATGRK